MSKTLSPPFSYYTHINDLVDKKLNIKQLKLINESQNLYLKNVDTYNNLVYQNNKLFIEYNRLLQITHTLSKEIYSLQNEIYRDSNKNINRAFLISENIKLNKFNLIEFKDLIDLIHLPNYYLDSTTRDTYKDKDISNFKLTLKQKNNLISIIENNKLLEDNIKDLNSNIMTLINKKTKKEEEILKLKFRIDTMRLSSKISSKIPSKISSKTSR